jgi:hypothetical protein
MVSGTSMHDPVDIRRRIDRVFARVDRRADYGELLARGAVVHAVDEVDDVEAWRSAIRRQARAERIKIRTGRNAGLVWAMLAPTPSLDELAGARRYRELLPDAVPLAVELWHDPFLVAGDGDEIVCACGRCFALGYGSVAEDVVGGALFEDECPNQKPPKLTALVMMHAPNSRWPPPAQDVA